MFRIEVWVDGQWLFEQDCGPDRARLGEVVAFLLQDYEAVRVSAL